MIEIGLFRIGEMIRSGTDGSDFDSTDLVKVNGKAAAYGSSLSELAININSISYNTM